MPFTPCIVLAAASLLLSSSAPLAPPAPKKGAAPAKKATAAPLRELWYGVYVGGKRAGYLARERQAGRLWQGKTPAVYSRMRLHIEVRAQGTQVVTDKERISWTTLQGAPLEEVESATLGSRKTHVRAVYSGRSLTYTADRGDGNPPRRGTLSIAPGEAFYARDPFAGSADAPAPGKAAEMRQIRYKDFNPDTLALENASLGLGRRIRAGSGKPADDDALPEVVAVGDAAVRAYRMPFRLDGAEGVTYEDEQGEMLRVEFGPVRIVRLPKARASASLNEPGESATGPADIADFAAYVPDQPIEEPRRLRRALYRIEGMTAPPAVGEGEGAVQKTAIERREDDRGSSAYVALFTVETDPLPAPESDLALSAVPRDKFRSLLAPSLCVPCKQPEIVALSRRVVGKEAMAGRAAALLSDYVHRTLTYDAGSGFGPPRAADQILKEKRGVCQDYATLLVTLCRAAGIPARHCSGLAYVDGRFYPHAWAEVWTGRWVALEPTWGTPFADATHIKLAEGEPTTDRPASARLDPLRIFVLKAETDNGLAGE